MNTSTLRKRKTWRRRLKTALGNLGLVVFIAMSFSAWKSFYPTQIITGFSYHALEVG